MARLLGIDRKTLYRWLKREDLPLRQRLLSINDQKQILKHFGYFENPLDQEE